MGKIATAILFPCVRLRAESIGRAGHGGRDGMCKCGTGRDKTFETDQDSDETVLLETGPDETRCRDNWTRRRQW